MPTTRAESTPPKLVLITGLSGSGKSTAAKALEDIGYLCVDNLPLPLLRILLSDPAGHAPGRSHIAIVTDVRVPGFAETLPQLVAEIDRNQVELLLLFLEASEESLVRRYSETRRSHPLAGGGSLIEGIRRERTLLAELRGVADLVFETSDWSVHDVRRAVWRELADEGQADAAMVVSLASFGFKHGIPYGSDLVFDVRFLPNPHFLPGLREQTGRDKPVQAFLEEQPDFRELLSRLESFLLFLLPRYRHENRSYLTIAVGCTGGHHRSVAVCEALATRLGTKGWNVRLNHRDLER